jgi:transposase InsO family protein
VKYRFIDDQRRHHRLSVLCRVLGVTRSGYYAWRVRPESARVVADRRLTVEIRAAFSGSEKTYGSPRIHRDLHPVWGCSLNRIARLMRLDGLRAHRKRRFKRTTDSRHAHPVAPNRLPDVVVTRSNQVWVTDITYIWTRQGWVYLAAVMDLYSRRIVGWTIRARLTQDLVIAALRQAIVQRRPPAGLLHHSDRGSQYAAGEYQAVLQQHGIIASMSGKGNCYDNAAMESCFATVKVERVYRRDYQTRAEVTPDLFAYIELFYNRKRRHSGLDYQSPVDFEMQMALC